MGPRCAVLLVLFLCATTTHFSTGLIVYKDAFTGDEMFDDTYKIKPHFRGTGHHFLLFYEVEGRTTRSEGHIDDALAGGADVSGEIGPINDAKSSGVDIILDHKLQEIEFNKKQFGEYLKEYIKRVKAHLEEKHPDRTDDFLVTVPQWGRTVLNNLKNYQYFTGETDRDRKGLVALLDYREDGVTPYMLFLKDGLEEEGA